MKKHFSTYITILALGLFILSGCNGSKHFTKMAVKQEAAGLVHEAANSYYTALQKKRSNVDAQIGLKKNGQLVLNEMLNEFAKTKNFGTKKEAVYAYHKARDYKEKVQGVGVTLQLADFYVSDYEAVKSAYLTDLYDNGTTLLEEQKYQEAESVFAEIRRLDPNYKDAKDLADIAYLEPLYAEAKKSMDVQFYRAAYGNLEKVIARKPDYKNAAALRKECLDKGMYTIAMINFENASGITGLDSKVSAYTLDALTDIQDPFLKVVDRENMELIIREQQLQLSGAIDENTAVQVGQLIGAQALLTGTVLSYSEKKGTLKSKVRNGYEEYEERVLNKTDGKYYMQPRYRSVTYTEYYNTNSCVVSFQYKLVNLKTGEILKTEIIEKEVSDEVLYGRYDGNASKLVPAGQVGPNLNMNDRKALQALMAGRQDLKSSAELSNTLFSNISSQLSGSISNVVKEIVK
ncbi:MAG: CsgG/HfaB family protein [Flavobacteriales bacterium]|nr:CsgG/HfaB family protein [Flavobacteriales bacterium]